MTTHLAMSMFATKEDYMEARIKELEADKAALMEVVRGAAGRKLDGERRLQGAISALPAHLKGSI